MLSPEDEAALQVARDAREERNRAEKAFRRAMREAFATGLPDAVIARRVGMRYDAVRMARRRSRV